MHDFDRWNHAVQTICGRFDTRPPDDGATFVGDIRARDYGGLGVAYIHSNASLVRRVRGNSSDEEFCFLVIQRRGVMGVRLDGAGFMLEAGDMALLDSARSFEMRSRGLFGQVSIHLRREALDRALPGVRRFGKLDQACLSSRLLRNLVQELTQAQAEGARRQDGQALQDAMIGLLGPGLSGADAVVQHLALSLRQRAESLIARSLHDQAPTPARLAANLGISARQLYRLFETEGDTVCRYIQRQRLQGSARDLTEPALAALSITTIAHKWGFADSAHFSRAFKRQYGLTPKGYRERG